MTRIEDPDKALRLDIIAANNVPFMVLADLPNNLVEFWDMQHPGEINHLKRPMLGQFTGSHHNITTLLGEDDYSSGDFEMGLNLNGSVVSWRVDKYAMRVVRAWLRINRDRAKE